jgi:hypothetical protein
MPAFIVIHDYGHKVDSSGYAGFVILVPDSPSYLNKDFRNAILTMPKSMPSLDMPDMMAVARRADTPGSIESTGQGSAGRDAVECVTQALQNPD